MQRTGWGPHFGIKDRTRESKGGSSEFSENPAVIQRLSMALFLMTAEAVAGNLVFLRSTTSLVPRPNAARERQF